MTVFTNVADAPEVLTPADVCAVLRKDVRRPCKTVRSLQTKGLRVLKIGRDLRVLRKDLQAFLAGIEAAAVCAPGSGRHRRRKVGT